MCVVHCFANLQTLECIMYTQVKLIRSFSFRFVSFCSIPHGDAENEYRFSFETLPFSPSSPSPQFLKSIALQFLVFSSNWWFIVYCLLLSVFSTTVGICVVVIVTTIFFRRLIFYTDSQSQSQYSIQSLYYKHTCTYFAIKFSTLCVSNVFEYTFSLSTFEESHKEIQLANS